MSNTSTTPTSTNNTQTKGGCCGGHDNRSSKHKPNTTDVGIEADAMPGDRANTVEQNKSGCCCGSNNHG